LSVDGDEHVLTSDCNTVTRIVDEAHCIATFVTQLCGQFVDGKQHLMALGILARSENLESHLGQRLADHRDIFMWIAQWAYRVVVRLVANHQRNAFVGVSNRRHQQQNQKSNSDPQHCRPRTESATIAPKTRRRWDGGRRVKRSNWHSSLSMP